MKRLIPLLLLCCACQEVEQPTTVLTQAQWDEIKTHILTEAPNPAYKIGAIFDGKIELIGFDVATLEAGKQAEFTWYWKALEPIESNWTVFVHLDADKGNFRQNLDHVPVNDLYQTSRWKKGEIIRDVQKVTIKSDFPGGTLKPYIGFFKGNTRMPVSNSAPVTSGEAPRVIGPTLTMKTTKKASGKLEEPPSYAVRLVKETDAKVTIDGKLDEAAWQSARPLKLLPFGNAAALATDVKVFTTPTDLYIGAFMEDKHAWGTLKNRDDETWKEEVLEFFVDIDGDGKDYLELQITPLNTIFDANFKAMLGKGSGSREEQIAAAKAFNLAGLESAVTVEGTVNDKSDEDKSWSAEIKIPLASIPGFQSAPKTGDTWAANFYRFDRTDDATRAYAWSTGPRGNFHEVSKFGKLKFAGPITQVPRVSPEMMKSIRENVNLQLQKRNTLKPNAQKSPEQTPKPR